MIININYYGKNDLFPIVLIDSYSWFFTKKLDNAYLKCQYEYIWKQDTLSGKTRDDLLILQVEKTCLSVIATIAMKWIL